MQMATTITGGGEGEASDVLDIDDETDNIAFEGDENQTVALVAKPEPDGNETIGLHEKQQGGQLPDSKSDNDSLEMYGGSSFAQSPEDNNAASAEDLLKSLATTSTAG